MELSTFIAKRYFLSRRKKNFINWLTWLSVTIITICCAALIIAMSVFNGLGDLLRSLNTAFDPELKVAPAKGKSFEYNAELQNTIASIEGIELITEVIEDYAYIKYQDAEMVVTMKGVSEEFIKEQRLNSSIVQGEMKLKEGDINYAIVGQGVQYFLSIIPGNDMNALKVHYIKDLKRGSLNTSDIYTRKSILPIAVFSVQKTFDEGYIFVPLEFAKELLDYDDKRTSLEIKASEGAKVGEVKQRLRDTLGETFTVLDNEEQHADLYKLLKIEKLFAFITLVLILGVSAINILFVLSMLAIEKKKDISILYSLGAGKNLIRKIFLKEGIIISVVGASVGLFIGTVFCLLQQHVGLISMGMESAVQSNYPVKIVWSDFIYIFLSLVVITLLVSFRPARIASGYQSLENL